MPIYEYECNDCQHQFETLQKMSEDPLKTCPQCGNEALRKLVSAAAFRLKGSGWYETDFKDKKKSADAKKPDGKKADNEKAKSEASSSASKTSGEKSEVVKKTDVNAKT